MSGNRPDKQKNKRAASIINSAGTVVAQPAAYANIHPLKAALNFDSVEGFGDWHILVSTQANKDLRTARRKNPESFRIYVKKIKELSKGHFSYDNHKRLIDNESDIPVYEAKMEGDSRLVYMIDCIREYGQENERQVIKLFGIYTHALLERNTQTWKNVSKQLSRRGREYRKRVIYRTEPVNKGDKVYAPMTFPLNVEQEDPSPSVDLRSLPADEQQDLHKRLALDKFSTFSQAFLNSIEAEEDTAHVFHMSPTEQDIVRYTGSCYVYGRSGTGKTTTMVFKILGIERAYELICEESDADAHRPRQLFVTYSRFLAEKVRDFYVKLAREKAAAGRTARESTKLTVEKHAQDSRGLVNRDEEELYDGTLPSSFSKLTDDHFPLFITFDQLCRLLEADQKHSRAVATCNLQGDTDFADESMDTTKSAPQRQRTFVSYSKFYSEYWPHLPQNLTKIFDPALVFAEIMGVIKGSEESIKTEKGFLDRDTYINLSDRSRATFATRREEMYSIFQAYNKRKQECREWDAADRTHSIIRGLDEFGVPGRQVDYLYVDEVQDNLLVDTLILRSMCKNLSGLFWAGDTAQTISPGSSFRFKELKAFLYREDSTSIPKEFELTVNYRSHGGIVKAAHSVVQLISRFWPYAIDKLAEEKGIVDGAKPIFFTGWEGDRNRYERSFFRDPEGQIEFGADQCILVRDDAARDELRKQFGNIGLVMTLYESKGLEFNDVLLYNFFQDSTVDEAQWRVILNALPYEEGIKGPVFDDTRHNGVCRELKFLYVAITRARQKLWIADSSKKSKPLRLFWTKQDLVESVSAYEELHRLARASTPEEWAEKGKLLFINNQYSQAIHAYTKANLSIEKDIATAYYLREVAQSMPQGRNSTSNHERKAFLKAAEAFALCASAAPVGKAKLSYYRISAECYEEASENKKATEMYLLAEEHTEAAKVVRKRVSFDEVVDIIDGHPERIEPADAESIRDVANTNHSFKHYSLEHILHRATRLFSDVDVDHALEFMAGSVPAVVGSSMSGIRVFWVSRDDRICSVQYE